MRLANLSFQGISLILAKTSLVSSVSCIWNTFSLNICNKKKLRGEGKATPSVYDHQKYNQFKNCLIL